MAEGVSDESFRAIFEPHRRSITLHCYRMLGSLHDAEEIVQETLLRAWQRQADVRSGTMRPWLYKIATNACLDHLLKLRRRRTLPHLVAPPSSATAGVGPATDERLWLEPVPDALLDVADDARKRPDQRVPLRESVGLAFISALQWLSPKQRAALLLVDVLEWQPQEVAALLETSLFSVNSLLQRARKSLAEKRGEGAPGELSPSDAALLQRFISAWESGDPEALSALLTEDAAFSMPPQPEWFAGREAIAQFFAAMWSERPGQRRLVPLAANGGPAVAVYRRLSRPNAVWEPSGITLLTLHEGRISHITRFGSPGLFPLFGLPNQPPGD
ncbi:MAG TPA: RNA polymerase subunit sigma-70 [Polyangiaceae bacterium]|nr:RNA polymerase subunit sigma-70 [Polyangiaceae bacterium]